MKGEPEDIRKIREDESYVEYFLNESHKDYEEDSKRNFIKAWKKLEDWAEEENKNIDEITRSDAEEFADHLMDEIPKLSSAGTMYRNVSNVVSWLAAQTDEADRNPYEPFKNKFPVTSNGETEKLDVGIEHLREAVNAARELRIEVFVYLVIALKTGLRSGEILNIDLRDINLDHPISKSMPAPRNEVQNYPDSIHIDSTVSKGEEYNGEVRDVSNKERSTREIPIDDELKSTLVWWIGMLTPSESDAEPLIRRVTSPIGERMSRSNMKDLVTEWARKEELNDTGMKHFGVDSHWCRHWFSTLMRARIDDDEVTIGSAKGYVQGLRGDSDDSTIETYTHEWDDVKKKGKSYREVFEDNVPKLFTGENKSES